MTRYVKTDAAEITYELNRKAVKNLNLRVSSDGTVKVSVPYRVSYKAADEFVKRNAEFILKAVKKAKEKTEPPLDRIYFLGNRLELKVIPSEKNSALLTDRELTLYIKESPSNSPNNSEEEKARSVHAAVKQWQKEKGRELFPDILQRMYIRFSEQDLKIPFPALTVKSMKTRWGSCTAGKGKICLNASLVEKPTLCIEYVICHELSHLIIQNHSQEFYTVLSKVFPNHKEVKKLLNAPNSLSIIH